MKPIRYIYNILSAIVKALTWYENTRTPSLLKNEIAEGCIEYEAVRTDLVHMIMTQHYVDPLLREHYGYSVEQALMRRNDMMDVLQESEDWALMSRIFQVDRDLISYKNGILQLVGVDVTQFIK